MLEAAFWGVVTAGSLWVGAGLVTALGFAVGFGLS